MTITGTNKRYLPALNYHSQGLNGLFSGWRKWARKAVGLVGEFVASKVQGFLAPFGKEVGEAIRNMTTSIQEEIDPGYYIGQLNAIVPLTLEADIIPADQVVLDAWVEANLKPFIENLIKDIKTARTLSGNARLTALNAIINKMAAAQLHYATSPVTGVTSAAAAEDVQKLLAEVFAPIKLLVTQAVKETGLTANLVAVTFPANTYSYTPLFSSSKIGTVTAQNYSVTAVGSTNNGGAIPTLIKETNITKFTNTGPTKEPVKVSGNNTPVLQNPLMPAEVTPTGAQTNVPEKLTPGSNPDPAKKDNTAKYVAGGIAAIAVVYFATRKKAKATK